MHTHTHTCTHTHTHTHTHVPLAHGTFIGSLRLELNKPTQLPLDTTIRFGASTRSYTLREKPQVTSVLTVEGELGDGVEGGTLLGLPELDNEVDVCFNFY